MNTAFKVAAVQAAPVFLDLEASIDKAIGLIEEAAAQDVKVISFPETWLPGYPWWIWLGAPAWGMQFLGDLVQNSIEKGSPQEARLAAAADKHNMHVIMGVSERSGGSLYMGQWHFGTNGEIVNQRRKLKPTHVERTVFGESDGSGLHVSETDHGRIGALCCWEHLQPLSKYAMYSQNEQIHCAAWPSFTLYEGIAYSLGWQVNTAASLMYAAEGQCFVLAACGVISDDMISKLCDTDDKHQFIKAGGGHARIYGPDGSELATPLAHDQEGLLVADIDLNMISYAKAAADPAGHYSRPDVTRLMLNKNPAPPVVSFADGFKQQSTDESPAVQAEGAEAPEPA